VNGDETFDVSMDGRNSPYRVGSP